MTAVLESTADEICGDRMMLAGRLVKPSVALFGELGHTTASLFVSAIGFGMWAVPTTWMHFGGVIVQGFGRTKRSHRSLVVCFLQKVWL